MVNIGTYSVQFILVVNDLRNKHPFLLAFVSGNGQADGVQRDSVGKEDADITADGTILRNTALIVQQTETCRTGMVVILTDGILGESYGLDPIIIVCLSRLQQQRKVEVLTVLA